MSNENLCPFSKPIIGKWCQCSLARLADRCSGKMICTQADQQLPVCEQFSKQLLQKYQFVAGVTSATAPLTHAQTMKVRCGSMQGLQRLLNMPPDVPQVIAAITQRYGGMEQFPFQQLLQDIKSFSHRKSARTQS